MLGQQNKTILKISILVSGQGLNAATNSAPSYIKDELWGSYSKSQKRTSKILFCQCSFKILIIMDRRIRNSVNDIP